MTYGGVSDSDRSCPKCETTMVKDGPMRFYRESKASASGLDPEGEADT